jgi:GAF domain-containing protein
MNKKSYIKTECIERESLLSNIITHIINSLDMNDLKKKIVTEIGKSLKADRCVINRFDHKSGQYLTIDEYSEYLSSSDISSFIGINIETDIQFNYFKNLYLEQGEMFAPDWIEYLDNINSEQVSLETKELIKTFKIKSNYVFPINYQDQFLGSLYLTYVKNYKVFSDEEYSAIKTLINQIGIAIKQSELFALAKEQIAEREQLLRKITEKIRSSLDINETLTYICNEVAGLFNVQRATITSPLDINNTDNIIVRSEYTINKAVMSIGGNTKISKEDAYEVHRW